MHWLVTRLEGLGGIAASAEMLFACVIAALIHDVGHDGRANAYHNATWDEAGGSGLALLYSDCSTLERHHCATGFGLMRDHGLLASLPLESRRGVRDRAVGLVLTLTPVLALHPHPHLSCATASSGSNLHPHLLGSPSP